MIALLLLVLAASVSPTPLSPYQMHLADVRKAIDAGNAAYISTWERGDAAAFAALYAQDASSIDDTGAALHGRPAIQAAEVKAFASTPLVAGSIHTEDLIVDGGNAYEMGHYTFTVKPKGKSPTSFSGRYLTIWTQLPDRSWKIHTDIGLPARVCGKDSTT
jgi:uncharacterized protein (TIGR02246 family)